MMYMPSVLEFPVMLIRSTIGFVLVAMAMPSLSQAALTLSVGDLSLGPGQTGSIDVTVEGTGDLVGFLGFEFVIVPDGSTTSTLRFVEEDEVYLSDAGYVFFGNSAAEDDGITSSVGTVLTSSLPDDTFVGGDFTADLRDVSLRGSRLLTRLRVEHDFGAADPATTIGHDFSVALVPAFGDSSAFVSGTSNTGFSTNMIDLVSFASTPGTVMILIPEPSSLVLAVMVLVVCIGARAEEQRQARRGWHLVSGRH